jgi:DNA-binding PadR family transcriptional regulator
MYNPTMNIPRLSAKEAEVLRLLIANSEMYGLEMVQRSTILKRGTVYVTLSRMGDKGYVESRLEDVSPGDGPARRLYKVTGLGVRVYRAMEQAARVFAGGEVVWGF